LRCGACGGDRAPVPDQRAEHRFCVRLRLLLGGFEYGREGSSTSPTAACSRSAHSSGLLDQSGFRNGGGVWSAGALPKALGNGRLSRALVALNRLAIPFSMGVFGYQLMATATALPTVRALLERSRDASADRRGDRPPATPPMPRLAPRSPAPPALRKPAG